MIKTLIYQSALQKHSSECVANSTGRSRLVWCSVALLCQWKAQTYFSTPNEKVYSSSRATSTHYNRQWRKNKLEQACCVVGRHTADVGNVMPCMHVCVCVCVGGGAHSGVSVCEMAAWIALSSRSSRRTSPASWLPIPPCWGETRLGISQPTALQQTSGGYCSIGPHCTACNPVWSFSITCQYVQIPH